MAQTVSRRPLTAGARVRSRVSPCGICGGQSCTGTRFSPSTSVLACQFHSKGAPLHRKTKKNNHLITGLHNKPQGCGASVASAAGPFTTIKTHTTTFSFYSEVTLPEDTNVNNNAFVSGKLSTQELRSKKSESPFYLPLPP
jgi:hypothetical protein